MKRSMVRMSERAGLAILFPLFYFLPSFLLYADGVRGIWVECEGTNQTLSTPLKLDEMLKIAEDSGINNIFLQVYRHNRAWYNSKLSDNTPFDIIQNKYAIDPLGYTIARAHNKNIKVHAWLNVFRVGKDIDALVIKNIGLDAITCDGAGLSLAKYSADNLPDGGYWLDPGDPDVVGYMLNIIKELMGNYPQLDGIHLDYIRYPYKELNPGSQWSFRKDFGYGKASVSRFFKEYGFTPLGMDLTDRLRTQKWDDWRRRQLTGVVRDVYKLCRKERPDIKVSCAVQPWLDRAYMVAYQDWAGWMEEGIVDFVVLMNYSVDRKIARYLSQTAISLPYTGCAYIGLGAYLMTKTPFGLYEEIKDCQELNAKGIVLFSYDALLKNKKILKTIAQEKWWER